MEAVYRKYDNDLRFFKVIDVQTFQEIQIIGTKYQQYLVRAKTYPERVFIQDLIDCSFQGVQPISEMDFKSVLAKIKSDYTEIKPHQN